MTNDEVALKIARRVRTAFADFQVFDPPRQSGRIRFDRAGRCAELQVTRGIITITGVGAAADGKVVLLACHNSPTVRCRVY